MCQYHEKNPSVRQTEIGAIFGVERSTVSKVLRQKDKYLFPEGRSLSPVKRAGKGKFPDIDRTLATWVRNTQKQGIPVTDAAIREKARFFAATVNDNSVYLKVNSTNWLEKFKQNNGIGGAKPLQRAPETNILDSGSWDSYPAGPSASFEAKTALPFTHESPHPNTSPHRIGMKSIHPGTSQTLPTGGDCTATRTRSTSPENLASLIFSPPARLNPSSLVLEIVRKALVKLLSFFISASECPSSRNASVIISNAGCRALFKLLSFLISSSECLVNRNLLLELFSLNEKFRSRSGQRESSPLIQEDVREALVTLLSTLISAPECPVDPKTFSELINLNDKFRGRPGLAQSSSLIQNNDHKALSRLLIFLISTPECFLDHNILLELINLNEDFRSRLGPPQSSSPIPADVHQDLVKLFRYLISASECLVGQEMLLEMFNLKEKLGRRQILPRSSPAGSPRRILGTDGDSRPKNEHL